MRDAGEIRQHFLELLNHALPRLSMYGDEQTALHFLNHLAFIDEREDDLESLLDGLTKRGAAISATRVSGAFQQVTGHQATEKEIASVYAEVAFQMGYLDVGRLLSGSEFANLKSGLRDYCRDHDLTTSEVKERFGDPSWFTGTNPVWPCVYLYISEEPEFGSVAFDFWNEIDYDEQTTAVNGRFGDIPALRNVRIHGNDFKSEFTFTPIGREITKRS